MHIAARFERALEGFQVGARAEVVALGRQVNRSDRGTSLELCERGEQLVGRLAVERVLLLRTRQHDAPDRSVAEESNARHESRLAGRPSSRARVSSTSSTMRSIA